MYVDRDVAFGNLGLTSLQLDHENELRILRKRLEQVGLILACIRYLSERLHSSVIIQTRVKMVQKHIKHRREQVILEEKHHEMDLTQCQHESILRQVLMDQVDQCPCLDMVQPEIASLASLAFYNTQALLLELYLYNPLNPNPVRYLHYLQTHL